jgi:hypothetical protein
MPRRSAINAWKILSWWSHEEFVWRSRHREAEDNGAARLCCTARHRANRRDVRLMRVRVCLRDKQTLVQMRQGAMEMDRWRRHRYQVENTRLSRMGKTVLEAIMKLLQFIFGRQNGLGVFTEYLGTEWRCRRHG